MMDTSTADEQGWIGTIPNNITFASLVGVPATGFSSFDNINYTMASSYYFMHCPQATSVPYALYFAQPHGMKEGQAGTGPENYQTLNFSTNPPGIANGNYASHNITLASVNNATTTAISSCALHASNVEVKVSCSQMSCGVAYIRRSPSSPWDIVPNGIHHGQAIGQSLRYLPGASGLSQHEAVSSMIELFLNGSSGASDVDSGWVDLTFVSGIDLSVRFTQLFNTYYTISLSPFDVIYPEPLLTDFRLDPSNTSDIAFSGLNQSSAIGMNNQHIYTIQISWIIIFFICTLLLFLATVFNAILGRLIMAPDIIGYVSTLTRDNSSISLPPGGSTLSGTERARLLKDKHIRLGDVCKDDGDIGYLRVRLGDDTASLRKLTMDKVYA